MVAHVGGGRPAVSCELVHDALVGVLGLPSNGFSVHPYRPEDFLVVFATAELRDVVLARPTVNHKGAALFFRKWMRQSQATFDVWRAKVDLVIEGVPPHAFDKDVVEDLLGTSCCIDEIAPETASRADLATFKVSAWPDDVERIPPARMLAIPEPVELGDDTPSPRQALSDDTCSTLPAREPSEIKLLRYKVLIHVDRSWRRPAWSSGWTSHRRPRRTITVASPTLVTLAMVMGDRGARFGALHGGWACRTCAAASATGRERLARDPTARWRHPHRPAGGSRTWTG
ncbi:hypothetical protein ACQ4PT_065104 [Festuca glaucescens]